MKKVNKLNFKKTLGKFSTGVTVVCVKHKNVIFGKTVNSFNSLSLSPPMVLFSLGIHSSSINKFIKSKYLTINVLSRNQKNISNNFSEKNPDYKQIDFFDGQYNTSLISGCIANLECKLVNKIKKGDHIIFICEVLNISKNDKLKPLIYFNSQYN